MILYRQIIKQAWRNTVQNSWLWVAGVFAAILTNIGQYNNLVSSLDGTNGWLRINNNLVALWTKINLVIKGSFSSPLLFIICLLIICLALVILFLAVNGQIFVVKQVELGLKSEGQALPRPKRGYWKQLVGNWSTFWSAAGVIVAVKVILLFCLLVISLLMAAVYIIRQPIVSSFFYILLSLIFLVLIWFVAVWARYWILLLLTGKKNSWLGSAKQAWQMLRQNILVSLEMSIVIVLINMLAYLLWVFVIYLLAIPFVLLTLLLIKYLAVSQVLLIAIANVLLIASLLVLVGFMVVFETSLWLNFMNNLSNKKIISRLSRLFQRR